MSSVDFTLFHLHITLGSRSQSYKMCDIFCCCPCSSEDSSQIYQKSSKVTPSQTSANSKDSTTSPTDSRRSSEHVPIKRKCTDVFFLVLNIVFVIILIMMIAYCFAYGNIKRIVNGYDDCGNICGTENEKDQHMPCKGSDRTSQKFIIVDRSENPKDSENPYISRRCVERCEAYFGYRTFFNRCVKDQKDETSTKNLLSKTGLSDFFQDVSEDLSTCWREMIYACLISLVFSFLVLILFRYLVGLVVWIILLASVVVGLIATIFLWVKYGEFKRHADTDRENTYLIAAIIASILTVVVAVVIILMRNRIKLVIQLFVEAAKALTDLPYLLLEPFLSFLALASTIALFVFFALVIESSGKVQTVETGASSKVLYVKDGTMVAARWINLLAFLWFVQFLFGCQDFVIAGAISKWFFSRNKAKMSFPLATSFGHLIRYHLGSVCFGSLLIAIIQLIRIVVTFFEKIFGDSQNPIAIQVLRAAQCCMSCFQSLLQYLGKNAYIMISMDGSSFCVAGKRAFRILSTNSLRVIAINSIGDFVLFLGKVFVVVATVLIGIELIQNKPGLHYASIPIIVCGVFAFLVCHCFLTVYEMTIDTIFLCFCEDCERNDGITRPYYMSRGLMEFVQNSKNSLEVDSMSASKKTAWVNNSDGNGIATIA